MMLHFLEKMKCSNLLHFVVYNKKNAIVIFVIHPPILIIFGA